MLVNFLVLFAAEMLFAKICQFTCYFNKYLILVCHLAMNGSYALNDMIAQICHAVAGGAVLVYWHHGENEFQYFTMQDNDLYHQELRNLRNQRIRGVITRATAGEPLVVAGNTFHIMETTFANIQCAPYMLLRKDGNTDHLDETPYLFNSVNSRDAAVAFINRS